MITNTTGSSYDSDNDRVSWAHAAGVCWTVLFMCRGSAIIQVIPKRSRFFFLVILITSAESFSNSFLLLNQLDSDWAIAREHPPFGPFSTIYGMCISLG